MAHTLESIAKLAGVSRGTVSRVINGQPGVREEVRKKVLEVIREHQYQPNMQARGLAGGKTENIGVVVFGLTPSFLSHHIFYEVIQGIQEHVASRAYDLLLFADRRPYDMDYWRMIADKRKIDGLIVMGEDIQDEYLQYYYDKKLPFVLVGKRLASDIPLHCVTSDYSDGVNKAVTHLIAGGKKRILYISGYSGTYHESKRYEGYCDAHRQAGLPADPQLIVAGYAEEQRAYEVIRQLVQDGRTFDAIFAANDIMALGVVRALQERGLRVPEDIAVVGYDDIAAARYANPPLSTVRQDKSGLGEAAARMLLGRLAGELDPSQSHDIYIPNELIVRSSS
ncbi:LacI family transcriptional regulator [Paenibacillus sp. J5C_2022]|uniref:LacI family DNA-binding transcriptional regulator n=1 Tax=Paenibacillus sp. J5C2022 TaxID=2977129 RepID=UPI0021D387E3|nr:LacI family DNA-binding transcriptional regulator [Paenibacillus sp. J5C2022]MCU6711453.1 LacI family transcriptional regulator [Paenibacillus sp. J5C2022]